MTMRTRTSAATKSTAADGVDDSTDGGAGDARERETVRLEGTVALVTGGAKRVGRTIVLELARAGCDVAIHYCRSRSEAVELVGLVAKLGRRAVCIAGDLRDSACWPEIVERTIAEFGRLDILVNNASVFQSQPPDTIDAFDPDQWESIFRVNLVAPMGLCHHARPHLEAQEQSLIVNLCDISGERPWKRHLAYCASKAGLVSLTKALARALAPRIRVNGVAPGIAVFPDEYDDEFRRRLTSQVPLAREGTPEEVASLVRFLAERGDYITGQVIAVDGGRSLA